MIQPAQPETVRPEASGTQGCTPPYRVEPLASVVFGEPNQTYHADQTYLSNSQIKVFRSSPQEFYDRYISRTLSSPQTGALARGTAVHLWCEIGDREFRERVRICPPEFTTAGGAISKRADEWLAGLEEGTVPLSAAEADSLFEQVARIAAHPAASRLLDQVLWREFSIRWTDDYGNHLRCRPDAATPDCFLDFKTTRDAYPSRTWWKACREYRYAQQAAIYRWGARQAGWPDHKMIFIVTSTEPPYRCHVCTLPDQWVEREERAVLRALEDLRIRMEIDCWSEEGHGEVCELFVPRHAMEE